MALNIMKCYHLTPLGLKGLSLDADVSAERVLPLSAAEFRPWRVYYVMHFVSIFLSRFNDTLTPAFGIFYHLLHIVFYTSLFRILE